MHRPSDRRLLVNKKDHKLSSLSIKPRPCRATLTDSLEVRRSSDYHRTVWDANLIESIRSPYSDVDHFNVRVEELKLEVKQLLKETFEPLAQLELIDSISRLGLTYHFEEEIRVALARFYAEGFEHLHGLKETALCFRLLREHGHYVSSDVFEKFREGDGFTNSISQDAKGLLSLYEATHLSLPGEQVLEETKEFSVKHLRQCLSKGIDSNLHEQVEHSLEAPFYWQMPRLEARHYIDYYEKDEAKISCLLELAKLDFNLVQALHQKDIKELSRWWENLGLANTIDFSRDWIVESYQWGNGTVFEPQFSKCRKVVTKVVSFVNVIDDFYDVYSTLEEAEQFTIAIRRWDLKAMEDLPDYMKLCYFSLYNFVNESAYEILQDSGFDVRRLLIREFVTLCEAYLKEAKWIHKKITPSLEEYLEDGWISIGCPIVLVHALYFVGLNLTQESLDHMEHAQSLIYHSSLLLRLIDDLALSKAEKETFSAIQCRMRDTGESYESAKQYIKDLINKHCMELNKKTLDNNLSRILVSVVRNVPRACFTISQEEDSSNIPSGIVKGQIRSLFIDPIVMD